LEEYNYQKWKNRVRNESFKTQYPIYEGWSVTYNSKGQRPVILVEQQQTVFLSGAAHRNLLPFYQVHLNHTQVLPLSGFHFNSNLTLK
ncbi:MAG TPA: hypothetical protein PK239_13395, partial [Chitinophagales bacterium]|nr:hypothetical protein [Chitinophagales bacterium]